ncbi:MAG: cation:proton antiporter [Bacteroidota bacterium]
MILAAATSNKFIALVALIVILVVLLGLVLKRFKQPYIISYILVGAVLGETGLIENEDLVHYLGELGIILLLFFIGMEISLPEFVKQWRVALFGTISQVVASVLVSLLIGYAFDWSFTRSVVVGFVIALSSSAVIIKLLEEKGIMDTRTGRNVLSVLLMQDIIIVPMLIIISTIGGEAMPVKDIVLMIIGGFLCVSIIVFIYIKKSIQLPFANALQQDHELQVFAAILFCFGGALISSLFGISPALGAFIGGMVMRVGKACDWIHTTLHSFRVLFVAVFFIGVGLQIDLAFIADNMLPILSVLVGVYLTNHLLNTLILRLFSCSWQEAFLGGALLAQIGELSFLLSSLAYNLSIIEEYTFTFTISLISLTLIVSPFWIAASEYLLKWKSKEKVTASTA